MLGCVIIMTKKITYPFKVNGLNKRGKEAWQYITTIQQAMKLRDEAQKNGISSNVFEKVDGKWVAYPF